MTGHAFSSPSGADGWMTCAGWRSSGESSKYANEGTDAHTLGSLILTDVDDRDWLGQMLPLGHEADEKMLGHVQKYVDLVRSLPGQLLVEQRMPLEPITGEKDAEGTGDAVVLDFEAQQITVVDLKYGSGIRVHATGNRQLKHYGLAAMIEYSPLARWKTVRGIICQPRVEDGVSEDTFTAKELAAFRKESRTAAKLHRKHKNAALDDLWSAGLLNSTKKACQWCVRGRNDGCPQKAARLISEQTLTFSPISEEIT